MRITTWAEYGLISALHLARRAADGPVTGRDLAARERLPADYVEQILLRLRRAGIVRSTRGARGGYSLARPAAEITVREVIAASELTTFDLHCVSHPVESERCSASQSCSIRPVWLLLQRRIDDVLDSVRLSDLLEEESVVRARVGVPQTLVAEDEAADIDAGPDELQEPGKHRRASLPVLQD
ncbi:MAG TPA: Rrf2 family transcriptional regulator [Gemmatimonadaceae bacterium]|nr:Rrf2 family transcriptional regulator [Gemmatimonadaceae bacterium]